MSNTAAESAQLLQHCQDAIASIQDECKAAFLVETASPADGLAGCGHALVHLLGRLADRLQVRFATSTSDSRGTGVLDRLNDVLSITYAKFYAFLYKDLPSCWRQLYTDASILKFCYLLAQSGLGCLEVLFPSAQPPGVVVDRSELKELVRVLDLALVLAGGAGQKRGRPWIDRALDLLYLHHKRSLAALQLCEGPPAKRVKTSTDRDESRMPKTFSAHEPFTPEVQHPIETVKNLTMEDFQARLDKTRNTTPGPTPLVIRESIESWPARSSRAWSQPDTLLTATFDGLRLVPVEIGRSYVDDGWGQKLITFAEFIQDYIDPSVQCSDSTTRHPSPENHAGRPAAEVSVSNRVGYLAQHPLFTQLPSLRNDILIPDYCYTAPPLHPTDPTMDQPELEGPLLNAWFGPPGTITPLHTDPYHNVLAQVVGRKYVRLYSPLETDRMRGRGKENGVEMGNTSLVDIGVLEGWDSAAEEDTGDEQAQRDLAAFREIPFVDCILEPGDVLYIPIGWWHYVRGLSVSFSVSFWWN
ncbi:uncharacterized protein B0I36DRAFT_322609 [Microdochium trichocladiopsis]|uniref:JmjC domain-containing protein n=1 Tax=Microdochium trichocladiopsis TaxID=1682393 RepID=A0A9P8Y6Y2_9PEZI|nr:uncharacterized protein B0I36DRAFT_322609 [Microdochium trichocladiopsis]KAH7030848.1 hypothetical protein B0I36DRAFT_322609 [Microdochium trichocladiopsis]